jgi:hypothetical protein
MVAKFLVFGLPLELGLGHGICGRLDSKKFEVDFDL